MSGEHATELFGGESSSEEEEEDEEDSSEDSSGEQENQDPEVGWESSATARVMSRGILCVSVRCSLSLSGCRGGGRSGGRRSGRGSRGLLIIVQQWR